MPRSVRINESVICVDFDGVIHQYEKWDGPDARGPVIEGIREGLASIKRHGYRICIFSTRPAANVHQYLQENDLLQYIDEIRDQKPYYVAMFDDRAHNVPSNKPWGLNNAFQEWLSRGAK